MALLEATGMLYVDQQEYNLISAQLPAPGTSSHDAAKSIVPMLWPGINAECHHKVCFIVIVP